MRQFENQSMTTILETASHQLQQNLPFVVYNKPNSNQLIGLFQQNDTLYFVKNFNEIGFIFAPFDGKNVLIPELQSEIRIANLEINLNNEADFYTIYSDNSKAKKEYEALVQKGIDTIKSGDLSKVVLSRKEIVNLKDFDTIVLFQRLLNFYPTAFTYCFFHPKVGLWLGAFSEQLLKIKNNIFYAMAVAGTQVFEESKEIIWGNKEKQEQQFVTDFIVEKFKNFTSNNTISEPYTLKAGNVLHIKTNIQGILNENSSLKQVLEILHPTPAVCGLPTDNAKNFILKYEGYDREYYSGFLGEINKDFVSFENNTDLYVNLRCMQIKNSQAHIYIGGGITKDSIPENEWNETVNKSMTIKKILDLEI